jgi:peptidoglycan/LPS O-acetylase OafA/YrhL
MRRAARILPAYYLALALSFAISITVFETTLDSELVLRLVAGLGLVSGWHWVTFFPVGVNSPLWSISFEAICYMFMPLSFAVFFALGRNMSIWQSRVLWVGVIGLALLCHWLFTVSVHPPEEGRGWNHGLIGGAKEWMPEYNPFGFYAMFGIGTLAAGLGVLLRNKRHWIFDILAVLFLVGAGTILLLAYRFIPDEDVVLGIPYGFPLFHLCVGAFLIAAPLSDRLSAMFEWRLITFISTISFGIYLYHQLVIELSARFLITDSNVNLFRDASHILEGLMFIAVSTIVLALVSFVTIERPVVKWARRREWKLRASRYV